MEKEIDTDWRGRLQAALKDRGISMRAASIGANLGPGVVNSWFKDGKEPSMSNLLEVCRFAGISSAYVIFGYQITDETARLLKLLEDHPERRDGILQLLQAK